MWYHMVWTDAGHEHNQVSLTSHALGNFLSPCNTWQACPGASPHWIFLKSGQTLQMGICLF
jgi:hypothetical protein